MALHQSPKSPPGRNLLRCVRHWPQAVVRRSIRLCALAHRRQYPLVPHPRPLVLGRFLLALASRFLRQLPVFQHNRRLRQLRPILFRAPLRRQPWNQRLDQLRQCRFERLRLECQQLLQPVH